MIKRGLYLDDIRTPNSHEWTVVRNYEEFVNEIKKWGLEAFDTISLDHDLGETAMIEYYNNVKENFTIDYNNIIEKTGYDAAKYLVAEAISCKKELPQIYVHSANPIGTGNIIGYVNNYYKNYKIPLKCVHVEIDHHIDRDLIMSHEERIKKWKKK